MFLLKMQGMSRELVVADVVGILDTPRAMDFK